MNKILIFIFIFQFSLCYSQSRLWRDGQSDYAKTTTEPTFSDNTVGTMECWFRADEATTTQAVLMGLCGDDDDLSASKWRLIINYRGDQPQHGLYFTAREDGTDTVKGELQNFDQYVSRLSTGAWHHVAWVLGREGSEIYVDGINMAANISWAVPSSSNTHVWFNNITADDKRFYLGNMDYNGSKTIYDLGGNIDRPRVHDIPLSHSEVLFFKELKRVGRQPGVAAEWTLDEKTGGFRDSTGNGNDMIVVGTAVDEPAPYGKKMVD